MLCINELGRKLYSLAWNLKIMFLLRGHDSIKKNLIIAKLKYEDNMTLLHRGRYSFYATEYSPESSTYEPG